MQPHRPLYITSSQYQTEQYVSTETENTAILSLKQNTVCCIYVEEYNVSVYWQLWIFKIATFLQLYCYKMAINYLQPHQKQNHE